MRYFLLISFLWLSGSSLVAQSTGNFMVGGGLDIVKTDNTGIAEKAQAGVELNYFLTRSFSFNTGFEVWSGGDDSLLIGMRWYPFRNAFLRFRGLIGVNDMALGGGLSWPLKTNLYLEGMTDLYVDAGEVGFRIGLAYLIRPSTK